MSVVSEDELAAAACGGGLKVHSIRAFSAFEFNSPPVVLVHGPPESGLSTFISSLLIHTQQTRGLDGAVVLTDRKSETYMGGTIPHEFVLRRPLTFEAVLKSLVDLQRHRRSARPDQELLRLAVAVDDCIPSQSVLKSESLLGLIRFAKEVNIMVIIGVSDMSKLPPVHTFATHVAATRCVSTEDPKLLQKRMFVRAPNASALAEILASCQEHEFLVGLLRSPGPSASTLQDFMRSYTPTYYVQRSELARTPYAWRGDEVAAAPGFCLGEFHMDMEVQLLLIKALGYVPQEA